MHIDGFDWLWMSLMMIGWVAVFAALVYAAVRLANQHERRVQ